MTVETLAPPLGSRFARALLVAFAIVHAVLAVGPGPTSAPVTCVALLALIGAAAIVVLLPGRNLSTPGAAAAVALLVLANAAVVVRLPADGWPGYAAWPIGAGTFVCIGLTLRARIRIAWLAMTALLLICLLWSIHGGAGPLAGLGLIVRQIGVLVIGTLFAVGLRRAARSAEEFAAVQLRQALERDLAETELRARSDAVRRVLTEAGPMLELIASGAVIDDGARAGIAALEGRLRDEIAIAPLLTETLDHALSAARSRGIDVVVLADAGVGDLPTSMRLRAAEWIAGRLDRVVGPAFVGRVVLRGQRVRVSATIDDRVEDGLLADD